MTVKILVVDDEEHIVSLVKAYLVREGYTALTATDGRTGVKLALLEKPDLIILDVMMPGMNGYDCLRDIRKELQTPVIFLTAKVDEDERVLGLELGADDYVTKPFYPRELMSRIRAVLRREHLTQSAPKVIQVGELILEYSSHSIKLADSFQDLTPLEFEILALLMSSPGRVFSRMDILEETQGTHFEGYERTIDLHVKNIRSKLEQLSNGEKYIETIYGVGYRFRRG